MKLYFGFKWVSSQEELHLSGVVAPTLNRSSRENPMCHQPCSQGDVSQHF